MGWLCSSMNDPGYRNVIRCKYFFYGHIIPYINAMMDIVWKLFFEFLLVPSGAGVFTKKIGPHIIINAHDLKSLLMKKFTGFAPYQARRSGYNNCLHSSILISIS